jgi:hypothetical protein
VSSKELTEWSVYYQLEPFGSEVDLLGHGIVAATLANVNRKKGTRAFKPADFMPKFDAQAQTVEEQMQFAAMLTAAMGGQDLREEEDGQYDHEPGGGAGPGQR